MSTLSFRTLEHEITSRLGFHDLIRSHVTIDAMASTVTSKHEALHGELLDHTPFGWFQKNLAALSSWLTPDSKYGELIEEWVRLTVRHSLRAHETYATYLSIKSYSRDEEASLLGRHPQYYRECFENLATRIDADLGASYLQYVVGKALVTAAFTCNIVFRVVTLEELETRSIRNEESPDARLGILLNQYARLFSPRVAIIVDESTREFSARGDLPLGFDPRSEKCWTALDPRLSNELDNTLMSKLNNTFLRLTQDELKLSTFSPKASTHNTSALFKLFIDLGELQADVSQAIAPSEHEMSRRRLGDVLIANDSLPPAGELTRIDAFYELDRYVKTPNMAITKELYADASGVDWRLTVFEDGSPSVFALSDQLFVQSLNLHRPMRLSEGNRNVVQAAIIGVRSRQSLPRLYERYRELFDHANHVARFGTAFWYMGGNLVDWIDNDLFDGELHLYISSIPLYGSNYAVTFEREESGQFSLRDGYHNSPYLPPRLFVLRWSLTSDYFIRLLPGWESYKLTWKKRNPPVSRFGEEERKYLRRSVDKIVGTLFANWRRI